MPTPPAPPPRKTLRKRLRALWKHSIFNPYYLDHRLLWEGIAGEAAAVSGCMLDVGCGDRPYAALLRGVTRYVGVEHPGAVINVEEALRGSFERVRGLVDAFGDAAAIPFIDASFDSCLCTEVLEHVTDPRAVLLEIRRVLKPGGRALITIPFVGELHQTPYDYWRFTPFGIQQLFASAGFAVERMRPRGNFPTVAGLVMCHSIYRLGAREVRRDGSVTLRKWAAPFVLPACAFVQCVTLLIGSLSKDDGYAMGYVVVARKP